MTRRVPAVLVAVLVAVLALAGCTSSGGGHHSAGPSELNAQPTAGKFQGSALTPPLPRPSFTLTDTTGKPFPFASTTAGHPTLLFFGYTQCPDVCPTTMADIAAALRSLPNSLSEKTYVVFVSTDVQEDTAPIIAKWLANFDPGVHATFVGLRGTQAQIDGAQAAAHVVVAEDGGKTHSAQVLLYGHDNYAQVQFLQSNAEAQQIAHDLPLVAG